MALRAKVLRKKAEKFEAKQLEVHKVTKERVSALESLLQDVYVIRRPKANDYKVRRELICVFNEIAKEIYGNSKKAPVVVEFGSFVMDLFSPTSDLDLSVNFNTNAHFPREKKIQTLRKFAKKLYSLQSKGHVYGVFPITTAKVPIVKVFDRGTGVECDISVENRDGILKSQIIHIISSIDERFHKLSFLMKNWAKAHNINSSKEKTLNSLSIILLVAFHLQTRNPPVLPPFSAILKDGTDPDSVMKSMANFMNYGKSNKESLAELFFTLLIKLFSVENLWQKGICASTCEGSWISKTWDSKVACISVEDFTDKSQNVARAVGQTEVKRIYKCIKISVLHVFSFLDGKIGGGELRELLFGRDNTPFPAPDPVPNGIPKLQQFAALSGNASQTNLSKTVLIGKKRKQETTVIIKKKPVLETQHATLFKPRTKERHMAGWDGAYTETQYAMARGHVGAQPAGSWGVTPQATASCGLARQPISMSWGEVHKPVAGSWGRTQQAGSWGRTEQPMAGSLGGCQQPVAGIWGGFQQPVAGSWGGFQQPVTESWGRTEEPVAGSWGGRQQPVAGSWGGFQQPVTESWGGAQQHVAGQRIRGSFPLWTNPNYRS
ncbi:protein HESO1-like isoform X2 [Primulina tabacum]|uniref:protein HESO1-like isoform X2 n=1 Tax=Primulina tabacum TaxID=48773 RepID=UPI003F599A78